MRPLKNALCLENDVAKPGLCFSFLDYRPFHAGLLLWSRGVLSLKVHITGLTLDGGELSMPSQYGVRRSISHNHSCAEFAIRFAERSADSQTSFAEYRVVLCSLFAIHRLYAFAEI
jgi:hypothetical protein